MGMGAEMYEEMMLMEMLEEDRRASRTVWRTRDGRDIPINAMTTDHIRNTIRYLQNHDKVVPNLMYEVLKIREAIGQ
jgi:hypothetical protein